MSDLVVVVAHPDDEVIGMAGVIAAAVRGGRRVEVGIVTNGDAWQTPAFGLRRNAESLAGLRLLGVPEDQVRFLGYPDNALDRLPRWRAGRTYALDGDFHFRRTGRHARRTRGNLDGDLRALVSGAEEVYTHVPFDGHRDHAALARFVVAAAPSATPVWGTLMHPPGAGDCLELSAGRWPGPAGEPNARFRPGADVEAPPSPACAEHPAETSWGWLGPPHRLVEVPAEMQRAEEAANLKWQAISCHESQVELGPVSAGYLRAFVRRHEFFWRLAG